MKHINYTNLYFTIKVRHNYSLWLRSVCSLSEAWIGDAFCKLAPTLHTDVPHNMDLFFINVTHNLIRVVITETQKWVIHVRNCQPLLHSTVFSHNLQPTGTQADSRPTYIQLAYKALLCLVSRKFCVHKK